MSFLTRQEKSTSICSIRSWIPCIRTIRALGLIVRVRRAENKKQSDDSSRKAPVQRQVEAEHSKLIVRSTSHLNLLPPRRAAGSRSVAFVTALASAALKKGSRAGPNQSRRFTQPGRHFGIARAS